MLGRLYMYRRNYTESLKYAKVLQVSPKNRRVHYLTRMYLRQKQLDDAEQHVNIYLKSTTKRDRALFTSNADLLSSEKLG